MKVDALFTFAELDDIKNIKVVVGQRFAIYITDFDGESDWFSNNDPVILLLQNGNMAEIEAIKKGETTIRIFDMKDRDNPNPPVLKQINIKVVGAINEAVSLGISISNIPK